VSDARLRGDFGRLVAGSTISTFGSMLTGIALPFLAIDWLGASPADIAAINAAAIAPGIVLGLFAAHAVDQFRRRPLLIACDIVRALLLLAVPLAAFAGLLAIGHLWLFAFLRGLFDFVFGVAHHAYLPALVEDRELVRANSRLTGADAAAEAVAFGAGGWLVQLLSAPLALLIDAFSYLLSAFFLLRIRAAEPHTPRPAAASSVRARSAEILAGLHELARVPALRAIAATSILLAVSSQVTNAVYMLFVYKALGFSPGMLGMLFALGAVGSLGSAVAAERLPARLEGMPAMAGGLVLATLGALALPLAPGATLLGVAAIATQQIVGDFGQVLYQIHQTSLRQRIVASDLLGRVGGAIRFLGSIAMLAGTAAGGILGETIGLRATLFVGAALLALAVLLVLHVRPVKA
jgi:MFS family permease